MASFIISLIRTPIFVFLLGFGLGPESHPENHSESHPESHPKRDPKGGPSHDLDTVRLSQLCDAHSFFKALC